MGFILRLLLLVTVATPSFAGTLPLLAWERATQVATGRAERGPWRMNESRFDYVDDPTVAIDARGAIAIAWVDQARKDVLFQRFSAHGKPLGQPLNVSRSPRVFSWLPRIAIDSRDRIFVLWQEIIFSGGTHGGDVVLARSEDGGATFSEPLNLSKSVAGDGKGRITREFWHNGSLDIAVAGDGVLYVAWTEYEGALWLRRSTDGGRTFSRPLRVHDARPVRAPALAVDGKRTLYLAWTVGEDDSADIRLAKSVNGGASFTTPRIIAPSPGYADAPKLALGPDGTLHLAYGESEGGPFGRPHVRYTRSRDAGRSFEAPRDISGAGGGFPALAVDGKGDLYAVWERLPARRRPRGLGIAVSRDGGRSFSPPAVVPHSEDAGGNGSLQGLLMRKLAVSRAGAIVIVNSSFKEGERSRVWLMRGGIVDR